MRSLLLAIAAALAGCLSYQAPPPVQPRPGPPAPIRIYSLWEPSALENPGGVHSGLWRGAASVAVALQAAGFDPVIVRRKSEIPPDAPYLVEVRVNRVPRCEDEFGHKTVITAGLWPTFKCDHHGKTFALHRSPGAPAQTIDTRWEVPWIAGWLAIPIGLASGYSPGFLGGPPDRYGDEREAAALRAALLEALQP